MFQTAPKLDLNFNMMLIPFSKISKNDTNTMDEKYRKLWDQIEEGQSVGDYKGWGFNDVKVIWNKPLQTITGNQRKSSFGSGMIHPREFRKLNDNEFCLGGTYPVDYDFSVGKNNENFVGYIVGMSVPPVMVAQIASKIYEQWICKFPK